MSHAADGPVLGERRSDAAQAPGLQSRTPLEAALHAAAERPVPEALLDALHRLLVASVQDYAIYAVTADGRVATWNGGAERLKGYAAAEIIGRPLSTFYPPEVRDADGVAARAVMLLDEAARTGRAEDEDWRLRRDGTRFWANVVITPVRDESGALLGFAKVTRDLTARRAAEEHARQLAAEQAAREAAERGEAEMRHLSQQLQEQALELEAQTEELQATATELEQTNEELQQTALEAERARDAAVTAQRAADELQARYRRLFEASPLPSWTVDLETLAILEANEAAVTRYGYTRAEFRALTLRELRTPVSAAELPRQIAEVVASGQFRGMAAHHTKHGEHLQVEITARAIVHDGRPAMVVVLNDVTERLRAEARQRFLVEASELLAESLDYEATLARIVRLAVPTLADWAAYNTLDGDYIRTVAIHHPDPAMERLAHDINARYPMRADAGAGVARVIATGASELVPEIPDELLRQVAYDETHHAQLRSIGFRSLVNVPLVARGRVLGALSFATGESGRRFTAQDLAFAEELGRRAGMALENALHFRAEQAARAQAERGVERLRRLERLAAAVSGAVELEAVSRIVVREARAALDADAVYLVRRVPGEDALELVHGEGLPFAAEALRQRFSPDMPVPGAHVLRTREPLWLESPAEREARFGHLADTPIARAFGASATLPLLADGDAVGSLGVYFAAPRAFGADDRAFLSALAEQVALTLERVRLFEAEHAARAEAEAARAAAEAANAAKSQFLSTMSHELRTPLNAIQGYTELLSMGVRGALTDAQQHDVERIRRANRHLMALVTDVLNFARLDAGQIEFRLADVELATIMGDLEPLLGPQLAAKRLTFDHDGCASDTPDRPHLVRADPEKLRQVLLNLLTNAIKFTDAGGRVALACEIDAEVGVVRVRVSDTGRGIPSDQLERIFEPFVQVDRHRTHESQQGVGLGLAISRDLARGMDGELTAESVVGEGSTFTLTLPLA
jgi:PAS domain S-box-containing protein